MVNKIESFLTRLLLRKRTRAGLASLDAADDYAGSESQSIFRQAAGHMF